MSCVRYTRYKKKKTRLPKTTEESNTFVYKTTVFDEKGWADAKAYKPIPYDMLLMKTDSDRIINGWWAEFSFYGPRLRRNERVLQWKRSPCAWGWND